VGEELEEEECRKTQRNLSDTSGNWTFFSEELERAAIKNKTNMACTTIIATSTFDISFCQ
jgi:hypothetical protein